MKKLFIFHIALFICSRAYPQFTNSGATLTINPGAVLEVNTNLTNMSGSNLINNGILHLKGDLTNHQIMSVPNNGTLSFEGSSGQTISGSTAFLANNVNFNCAAGIVILRSLKADGEVKFQNGLITASSSSEPMVFTSNGSVSVLNAPSNTSHINGYVMKEGNGTFEYPVGNGIQYQKVSVDLSSNSLGLNIKYHAIDGGAGIFSNAGTEFTPLTMYNTNEYWEVNPLGLATGVITLYWDGYNDIMSDLLSSRRVAHKASGNWLNEGANAVTGNIISGNVTSNNVNSWGLFAIGSTLSCVTSSYIINQTISQGSSYAFNGQNLTTAGTYFDTLLNAGGCDSIITLNLTLNNSTTVNLKMFIQGYYTGNSTMKPVRMNQGCAPPNSNTVTTLVTVKLFNAYPPYAFVESTEAILNTDGTCHADFTGNYYNGWYYISVKSANTLQECSDTAIQLGANPLDFDYSIPNNNNYYYSSVEVEPNIMAIASGEIANDTNMDLLDVPDIETDFNSFASGCLTTDLDGSGNVGLSDMVLIFNNMPQFLFSYCPF